MAKIGYKQTTKKEVENVYTALEALNKAKNELEKKDPDKFKEVMETIEEKPKEEEEGIFQIEMNTLEVFGFISMLKRLAKQKEAVVQFPTFAIVNTDMVQEAPEGDVVLQEAPNYYEPQEECDEEAEE